MTEQEVEIAANEWADTEGGYMTFTKKQDVIDTFKAGASYMLNRITEMVKVYDSTDFLLKVKIEDDEKKY